jgi:hypothetical protein
MTSGFAVIIPPGPGETERRRVLDLMDSLWTYEPGARLCVVIDDSGEARDLFPAGEWPGCEFVTLRGPFHGRGEPLLGRLSAGILLALRTIHESGPFEFIVRLDTDALIIAPFRNAVREFIQVHPEAGMVGTLGSTCQREAPYYGCEKTATSDVFRALDGAGAGNPSADRIREHARIAVENGYRGKEYCQGGAYVLPFETVARMASAGCLDFPEDWLPMAVPEDVMIGMYTRTVGLRSVDFSLPGQPFGNHHRGLAYSPPELVRRGHALIHSTKGDVEHSERYIRHYFRTRRRQSASK